MNRDERHAVAALIDAMTQAVPIATAHQSIVEALRIASAGDWGHFYDLRLSANARQLGIPVENALLATTCPSRQLLIQMKELDSYMPEHPLVRETPRILESPTLSVEFNEEVVGERNWQESGAGRMVVRIDQGAVYGHYLKDTKGVRWGAFFTAPKARKRSIKKRRPFLKWLGPLVSRGMLRLEQWRMLLDEKGALEAVVQASQDALCVVKVTPGEPVRMQACSGALANLLGVGTIADSRNAALAAFLEACHFPPGVAPTGVWTAATGQPCVLHGLKQVREGAWLVRAIPHVAALPPQEQIARDRQAALSLGLTAREAEILAMHGQGLANKEIARALHISPATARTHAGNILVKLGVSSRIEALNKVRTSG